MFSVFFFLKKYFSRSFSTGMVQGGNGSFDLNHDPKYKIHKNQKKKEDDFKKKKVEKRTFSILCSPLFDFLILRYDNPDLIKKKETWRWR